MRLKDKILKLAIEYIVWYSKNSNYIKHARNEFSIAWKDEECEMQNLMCNDVIELLSLLHTQGDSGSTIGYKLHLLEDMARFKTIAPLTFEDDEFGDPLCHSRQNKRDSRIFLYEDGTHKFLNDIIYKTKHYVGESNEVIEREGGSFMAGGMYVLKENGEIYQISDSRIKDIKNFKAESIYVDVYGIECPEDWWTSIAKESDLDIYFQNYNSKVKSDITEMGFNHKNGQYYQMIVDKINIVGKHMYKNDKFELKLPNK